MRLKSHFPIFLKEGVQLEWRFFKWEIVKNRHRTWGRRRRYYDECTGITNKLGGKREGGQVLEGGHKKNYKSWFLQNFKNRFSIEVSEYQRLQQLQKCRALAKLCKIHYTKTSFRDFLFFEKRAACSHFVFELPQLVYTPKKSLYKSHYS